MPSRGPINGAELNVQALNAGNSEVALEASAVIAAQGVGTVGKSFRLGGVRSVVFYAGGSLKASKALTGTGNGTISALLRMGVSAPLTAYGAWSWDVQAALFRMVPMAGSGAGSIAANGHVINRKVLGGGMRGNTHASARLRRVLSVRASEPVTVSADVTLGFTYLRRSEPARCRYIRPPQPIRVPRSTRTVKVQAGARRVAIPPEQGAM